MAITGNKEKTLQVNLITTKTGGQPEISWQAISVLLQSVAMIITCRGSKQYSYHRTNGWCRIEVMDYQQQIISKGKKWQ